MSFEKNSRYARVQPYLVRDHRGRQVAVVPVPPVPAQNLLGIHALHQGQRLDHLSAHYLDDVTGFWRIAELNEAMLPEALSEAPEIMIPVKQG